MNQRKLRIYGPIFLCAFLLVFFYGMLIHGYSSAFIFICLSGLIALLTWECSYRLSLLARKKFPGVRNTNKRIYFLVFTGLPTALLLSFGIQYVQLLAGVFKQLMIEDFEFICGLVILCMAIVAGIYEGFYYIANWKELQAEADEIKKINLENQIRLLKEQVKPHFLFNSLNTLISLIQSDPDAAIRFTEELSSVYRYLLRKNLRELSTLREEVQFIQLFISMLQTRFQDSLIINMEIEEVDEDALLPPFVLQLLVENAVKHNVVSFEKPLTITIKSERKRIIIHNTLQKKIRPEPSEKAGLLNLIERYRLLKKDHLLEIHEDESHFYVSLPLIRHKLQHILSGNE